MTDESWQDVLDYIEAHHMMTRLRNLDEELVQEIRGGILLESCGVEEYLFFATPKYQKVV